jgi:two-component system nitrogen regulation response regulator NtrX
VAAIKLGACDYIEKPLVPERVLVSVKQALRLSRSLKTEQRLTGQILEKYEIVGSSQAIANLRTMIDKAAATDTTVLITGENGSGKELVAHHIHYLSDRKSGPLVTINCPAIPESLFESELFGHVRGAFTGAQKDRAGRFEKADGGTVFLDEIGDLPYLMQGKLLRVLETGRFEKVGSDTTVAVDCRLVTATNRDLRRMVIESKFREDLFYRLHVITISVPPLRERAEDVPLLIDYFLDKMNLRDAYTFSSEAIGRLASFDWPGNIRQLKNFVEQVVFTFEPREITGVDVERVYEGRDIVEPTLAAGTENKLAATVRQFEIGFLSRIYQKHGGNVAAMARELGVDRGNLSRKLKHLDIV